MCNLPVSLTQSRPEQHGGTQWNVRFPSRRSCFIDFYMQRPQSDGQTVGWYCLSIWPAGLVVGTQVRQSPKVRGSIPGLDRLRIDYWYIKTNLQLYNNNNNSIRFILNGLPRKLYWLKRELIEWLSMVGNFCIIFWSMLFWREIVRFQSVQPYSLCK